jgi:hypothetical protein
MTGARVVGRSASAPSPSQVARWGRPGAACRRASRGVCRASSRVRTGPMPDGCRGLAPSCGRGDRWSGLGGRRRRIAHRRCTYQRLLPRDGAHRPPLSLPCTRACGSREAHGSRHALCACLVSRLRHLGCRLFQLVPRTPLLPLTRIAAVASAALEVAVAPPVVAGRGLRLPRVVAGVGMAAVPVRVI